MSCTDTPAQVQACCVSQNCLAEAYLIEQLRGDRRIRLFALRDCARISPMARRNVVFVIDQPGLEIPLSECIRRLRQRSSNGKFLLLGYDKSTEDMVRMLIMGVHGYLRHADVPRALRPAILAVASGALWVTNQALQQFLSEAGHALRKNPRTLETITPREDEILELVRKRLSNKEIAEILQIRVSTVKFHVSNIFSKLHAQSRHELAGAPGMFLLTKSVG